MENRMNIKNFEEFNSGMNLALSTKYRDYVLYSINFTTEDSSVRFLKNLSFVKGDKLLRPDNIIYSVYSNREANNFVLAIGGQLTTDQHKEIVNKTKIWKIEAAIVVSAGEETKVKRDFLSSIASTSIGGNNTSTSNSGCYIATACYGDYNSLEVLVFRHFRDNYLLKKKFGRRFIKIYYKYSPFLADKLSNYLFINKLVRIIVLFPIYKTLNFFQRHKKIKLNK